MAIIPYGRHSLMNGFGLTGENAEHPGRVAVFAAGFNTLFDRIHRLHDWRANLVRHYLDAMEESQTIAVETYLAAVMNHSPGKAEVFQQMCTYFGIEP